LEQNGASFPRESPEATGRKSDDRRTIRFPRRGEEKEEGGNRKSVGGGRVAFELPTNSVPRGKKRKPMEHHVYTFMP